MSVPASIMRAFSLGVTCGGSGAEAQKQLATRLAGSACAESVLMSAAYLAEFLDALLVVRHVAQSRRNVPEADVDALGLREDEIVAHRVLLEALHQVAADKHKDTAR